MERCRNNYPVIGESMRSMVELSQQRAPGSKLHHPHSTNKKPTCRVTFIFIREASKTKRSQTHVPAKEHRCLVPFFFTTKYIYALQFHCTTVANNLKTAPFFYKIKAQTAGESMHACTIPKETGQCVNP
jgi:hypothetical protein